MSDVNLKNVCPYSNMYYFCFFSDWVHRLYQMVPHNMCWAALYLTGLLLQSLHFIKHTHTHKHTNSLFMFTCGPGCCHRTLKAKVLRFQRQLLYIFKEMYIHTCTPTVIYHLEWNLTFWHGKWWNELPIEIRTAENLHIFRRRLKTHLFRLHFEQ